MYAEHTNIVLEVLVLGIPDFLRQDPKAKFGVNDFVILRQDPKAHIDVNDFVTSSTFVCWLASHQNAVSMNHSVQKSIGYEFYF